MPAKPRTLCLSLLACALALPVQGEDLLEVYDTAASRDPGIQAALAARNAALEAKPQARALLLPQINFSGDITRQRYEDLNFTTPTPSSSSDTTYSTNETYALSLSQPLFNWERWQQLKQADAAVAQAEAEYHAASQDLMLNVAELYFALLAAEDTLDFAKAEKVSTSRQLEQARERFEVGLIAITDVHEAQARYDLAVAQEIQAGDAVESAREALRQATGTSYQQLAGVRGELSLAGPEPGFVVAWVEAAARSNPALLAAQAQVEQARRQVEVNRAGHLPTLDLSADVSRIDSNFGGIASVKRNDAGIGVQLRVPVYSGGLTSSRIRQALASLEQTRYLYDQNQRQIERSTRDAFRGVNTSISQVKALKQALVSTETALEAAEEGFKVGTRTIVDVLNAQSAFHGARRDYHNARYDYLLNRLRLKRAAGTLSREDIARINTELTSGAQ